MEHQEKINLENTKEWRLHKVAFADVESQLRIDWLIVRLEEAWEEVARLRGREPFRTCHNCGAVIDIRPTAETEE